jgi:hypothetical protein
MVLRILTSCIVFALLGYSEITTRPFASIFLFALAGAAACATAVLLFNPSATCMLLDEDGIARARFGKIEQCALWREVQAMRIDAGDWVYVPTPATRVVIIDYSRDGQSETFRVWPRLYGLDADEFLALVSYYYGWTLQPRENWPGPRNPDPDSDRSESSPRRWIALVALALAAAICAIAYAYGINLHLCGRGRACDDSSIAPSQDGSIHRDN